MIPGNGFITIRSFGSASEAGWPCRRELNEIESMRVFQIMKRLLLLLLFACLLAGAGCGPKRPGIFEEKKPGAGLLQSAEAEFEAGRYGEAFNLYQTYVEKYPAGAMLPEALLNMGVVQSERGKYAQALAYLEQVVNNYPESDYAGVAAVERLSVLYAAGDYEQLVLRAGDTFFYELSDSQYVRAARLAGDAYMALDISRAAYDAFLKASARADAEKKKTEIRPRVQAAIRMFSAEQLQRELSRLPGGFPTGYLLYQLGEQYEATGKFGEAIAVLSDFLDRFPKHELTGKARDRIKALKAAGYGGEIRIGCLLPLSGKYADFGERALNGIELAVSLAGYTAEGEAPSVRLIVADTGSSPEKAVQGVQKLDARRVAIILGPLATAESAARAAQDAGIPMIAFTQAGGLPQIGGYVFRNFITPEMQVKRLADYAAGSIDIDRFAVLYPDEPYGRTFMNLFWDALLAHEASVTGLEKYNPEHTDFSASIKKLVGLYYEVPEDIAKEQPEGPVQSREPSFFDKLWGTEDADGDEDEADPSDETDLSGMFDRLVKKALAEEEEGPDPIVDFRAVFIPDSPEKAGLILPQLAYYDVDNVYCLGTNLWHSRRLIQMAQKHAQTAVFPSGFFAESPAAPVQTFVEAFESVYERKPEFIGAIGYDTARMVIERMRGVKYLGRRYICEQLMQMPPYKGVTGRTWFDGNGDAVKALYLLKVKGDGFVEVRQ